MIKPLVIRVKEKSQGKDSLEHKLSAGCCEKELLHAFKSLVFGVKTVLRSTVDVINALILCVKPGNSIILTLIFQTPLHEKEFMNKLKKLEQCVMEDLKHLPGCQGHDLSHLYVEVEVDEDLYEECVESREESKFKTGSVCSIPVSKPQLHMFQALTFENSRESIHFFYKIHGFIKHHK